MSHLPSSWATGIRGSLAAHTVATTKYTISAAAACPMSFYGDRLVAITYICDNASTLYLYGSQTAQIASTTAAGATSGVLLATWSGLAATGAEGACLHARIAGFKYFLPVLYNAGADNSDITLKWQTYNP